jgi:hypothetical protein
MANATKTAGKTAQPEVLATTKSEAEVRISPKTQRAVKALASAHEQEKVVKAIVEENREIILAELGNDTTKFGVDARGKRLVKIQLIVPKDPTRYDTAELVKFLAKTQPEVLAMFRAEDAKTTTRVLTLN